MLLKKTPPCNTAEKRRCVELTEMCLANVVSRTPRSQMSAHASTLLNLPCKRGVKYSEGCQKLKMEATSSDLDVLPFLWKCKRNNECDNLKTRNNYSLKNTVNIFNSTFWLAIAVIIRNDATEKYTCYMYRIKWHMIC
jgi:hypothetical protein